MSSAVVLWFEVVAGRGYAGVRAEACVEADVPFLPMLEPLLADSRWLRWLDADGLHLNSEGHAEVYRRVRTWPAMLQWAGLEMRLQPTS
ncbi:MAG: arylesterase, partial [Cyanobium sp.]